MAFRLYELQNFGLGYGATGVASPETGIAGGDELVWGIAISAESEIDACYISGLDNQVQGGLEGGDPNAGYFAGSGAMPVTSSGPEQPPRVVKLSTEHPLIGPFRGPLVVTPYYSYGGGIGIDGAGTHGAAKLSLRVYKDPVTLVPAGRSVLRRGWYQPAANDQLIIVPLFGRKLLRAWATSNGAATAIHVFYGWTTPPNGAEAGFQASDITVPASGAGGASLKTVDLPDFMIFQGAGGATTNLVVEAYDF